MSCFEQRVGDLNGTNHALGAKNLTPLPVFGVWIVLVGRFYVQIA